MLCRPITKYDFLECPLYFDEATEPTNIIWENRHFGSFAKMMRKFIVVILVGLFLTATVFIFFLLKKTTITN